MIILIPFYYGNKYLHRQLLCHITVLLKKIRGKDSGKIIEHPTVIYILIDIHLIIRIFPEKFQQIQQILSLFIHYRYCRTIVIIFAVFCLISLTKCQLI